MRILAWLKASKVSSRQLLHFAIRRSCTAEDDRFR